MGAALLAGAQLDVQLADDLGQALHLVLKLDLAGRRAAPGGGLQALAAGLQELRLPVGYRRLRDAVTAREVSDRRLPRQGAEHDLQLELDGCFGGRAMRSPPADGGPGRGARTSARQHSSPYGLPALPG